MGFKEDAEFARNVSMGAVGAAEIGRVLRDQHGHRPIELERYAMANKVWRTKIKRRRLPDLLCLRCGKRFEVRAKSRLGMVLSHSEQPERRWDEGGMRPEDLFVFARVTLEQGALPRVGPPTFISREALGSVVDLARESAPKAASAGSEVTMTWPSWVPGCSLVLEGIDEEDRIVYRRDDGKQMRYWHWRKWGVGNMHLYTKPGTAVAAGGAIVAGPVPPASPECDGDTWDVASALRAEEGAERHAGIKAAGVLGRIDLQEELARYAASSDWRMKVEALGALARLQPVTWANRIADLADDANAADEARMEAVFVLSEIPSEKAASALAAVASNSANPEELRAAAAWGLGRGARPRPDLLLPLIGSSEEIVSLHAIVALESIPASCVPHLVGWLDGADERLAASAARVLSRHRCVQALLDALRSGGRARLWALTALGDIPPEVVREAAGGALDNDAMRTLEPMWLAQRDWLRLETSRDGLQALDVQTVRFDPVNLIQRPRCRE